jgi:hypothetical protein
VMRCLPPMLHKESLRICEGVVCERYMADALGRKLLGGQGIGRRDADDSKQVPSIISR